MDNGFPYYTVLEAAAKAQESPGTIRRRIEAGALKAIHTSVGTLVKAEDMTDYLNRRGDKNGRQYYTLEQLMPESHIAKSHDEMTRESRDRADWEASEDSGQ